MNVKTEVCISNAANLAGAHQDLQANAVKHVSCFYENIIEGGIKASQLELAFFFPKV